MIKVIRSAVQNAECIRPCNFNQARGFGSSFRSIEEYGIGVLNKCTSSRLADCMLEIKPQQVIEELKKIVSPNQVLIDVRS